MKEQFLKEYAELCLKHRLELRGCGDCGSAWLGELQEEQIKNKTLTYEGKYQNIYFADNFDMKQEDRIKLK